MPDGPTLVTVSSLNIGVPLVCQLSEQPAAATGDEDYLDGRISDAFWTPKAEEWEDVRSPPPRRTALRFPLHGTEDRDQPCGKGTPR